jgi:hypothetical protein
MSSRIAPSARVNEGVESTLVPDRDAKRQQSDYRLRGRAAFDEQVARSHRRLRQGVPGFLLSSCGFNLLTTPIIYSLAVPLLLLDLWLTLYQWTCFPVYHVARVRRREYLVIDRHRLGYLNAIEKANCMYCSYANGVLAYGREIAARTEQYWCPIKHARRIREPHAHYDQFFEYGDAVGYHLGLPALRKRVRPASSRHTNRRASHNGSFRRRRR